MPSLPKNIDSEKTDLHPRNKHRARYDFDLLGKFCSELIPFVTQNKFGNDSIDFSNPEAVKILNKALLQQYYHISYWDIPANYLCPPIPGRADYIHYMADLLKESNSNEHPEKSITILDIGTGANLVYPIIGNSEYNWNFVGTDIDPVAIESAQKIITSNASLKNTIELRLQKSSQDIFEGIIQTDEYFDLTICNPPFHASLEDAQKGTTRKWKNLGIQKNENTKLNFGGQQNELWCEGGEFGFVKRIIEQSAKFQTNCFWYSTLISKKENLPLVYKALKKVNAFNLKTIDMAQGQKISRIVAWTFLNPEQQNDWMKKRWK